MMMMRGWQIDYLLWKQIWIIIDSWFEWKLNTMLGKLLTLSVESSHSENSTEQMSTSTMKIWWSFILDRFFEVTLRYFIFEEEYFVTVSEANEVSEAIEKTDRMVESSFHTTARIKSGRIVPLSDMTRSIHVEIFMFFRSPVRFSKIRLCTPQKEKTINRIKITSNDVLRTPVFITIWIHSKSLQLTKGH